METEAHITHLQEIQRDIIFQEIRLCAALENAELFKSSVHLQNSVKKEAQEYLDTIKAAPTEQLDEYLESMEEKIHRLETDNPQKAYTYKEIFGIALDYRKNGDY